MEPRNRISAGIEPYEQYNDRSYKDNGSQEIDPPPFFFRFHLVEFFCWEPYKEPHQNAGDDGQRDQNYKRPPPPQQIIHLASKDTSKA